MPTRSLISFPTVTAAAIDRLAHHSVIVELNMESCRMAAAQKARKADSGTPSATKEADA